MFQFKPLPRNIDAALRDLSDSKPAIRRSALGDLGRLAGGDHRERAITGIRKVLQTDGDPAIRAAAALALADADDRAAVGLLIEAAGASDLSVRQMAILALGELSPKGHREVSSLLRQALGHSHAPLRFQALLSSHRVNPDDAETRLAAALDDDDAKIRYLVHRLVDERWSPPDRPPDALLEGAKRALRDSDPAVRVAAAMVAASHGDDRGRQVMADAINRSVALGAPQDEQAAIELVGELGIEAAVPGLKRMAWGRFGLVPGPFSWHAKVALVRLGDETARNDIRRGLASRRRDVRTLAVAAVGHARWADLRPELERLARQGDVDGDTVADALRLLREEPG